MSSAATCDRWIYFESFKRDLLYAAKPYAIPSDVLPHKVDFSRQRTTTARDPVAQAFTDTEYELLLV